MTSCDSPSDAAAAAETEPSKFAEANLLEWLERFAERLKCRTNAVADEVQEVVEEIDAVELNLQNAFNNFRCLSSSQFVENHVYEEDETDLITVRISKKNAKKPSVPSESYEDEILPRYKDAVGLAWAAFKVGRCQNGQSSVKSGSQSKLSKLKKLRLDGMIQILPHIIGSEEFTRDIHCGLAGLGHSHHDPELDKTVGQDTGNLAAEPIDMGILSEGEISEIESEGFDSQEEGVEPAVSAALDFKAMLEAALRNPLALHLDSSIAPSASSPGVLILTSFPLPAPAGEIGSLALLRLLRATFPLSDDGGTSDDSLFVGFADSKFSLPNVTRDTMHNSPRTISTMVDIIGRTMTTRDESREKLRDSTSQESNANENKRKLPLATEPLEVLDHSIPSSTLEELLKKPLNTLTQAMLNQELEEYIGSNNGNRQAGTGDLGHVPISPGGFFNDEVRDTRFLRKEYATVPNSNTRPTIPEGQFQEELFPETIGNSTSETQSFTSLDSSRILPGPKQSLLDIVDRSSRRESDIVSVTPEKNGSEKSQIVSFVVTNHAILHSASSSVSSFSNTFTGSLQGGQLPSRGGLFDDDDEDEDVGDLFGAAAPRVDSHALRPWASQSSKELFDDIATENNGTTSVSDEAGVSQQAQQNSAICPLITSQLENRSGLDVLDFLSEPIVSAIVETYSGRTHVDLARSSFPRESVSNNQEDSEDITQIPIHSTQAATVRSFIDESDDDPWSGSESAVDGLIQGKIVVQQHIHQDGATKVSGNNDRGANAYQNRTAEGILGLMPEAPVHSGHLVQSVSCKEKPFPVAIHGEGANAFVSSQPDPDGLPSRPSRFRSTTSRSISSTETSPAKVLVNLTEDPLLHAKIIECSDSEASDSSGSASSSGDVQGVGQRGRVHDFPSGTSNLFENFRLSTSQPPNFIKQAGPFFPKDTRNNITSEDWSKISNRNLRVPVNEVGRSTRTFTPLFENDEAEEDLFGRISPQQQGALLPGTGKPGIILSSSTTLPITPGQSRVEETEASLTQNMIPQQPLESNPSADIPFSSHFTNVERNVVLSSTKPVTKSSSLLEDDDEDDEDELLVLLVDGLQGG